MTEYDYLIGKLCKDDNGIFFVVDVQPHKVNPVRDYAQIKVFWVDPEKMTKINDFCATKGYIKALNVLG